MLRFTRDLGIALIVGSIATIGLGIWAGLGIGASLLILSLWIQRRRPPAPKPYLDALSTEVKPAEMHEVQRLGPALSTFSASATMSATTTILGGTIPYLPEKVLKPLAPPAVLVAWFARSVVTNDPPEAREGLKAEHVGATVSFYDDAGACLISEMDGRWASTEQKHEWPRFGLYLDPLEIDIPSRDKPRPLDIAMKYDTDEDCYAFNNDNADATEGRLQAHRLGPGTFRVMVTLKANNVASAIVREFRLTNPGKDGRLIFDPVMPVGQ